MEKSHFYLFYENAGVVVGSTSAAKKIEEHNIDALIIPTGTYRYIKALLDTPLKDSQAAVHVIFHGIGKGEMDRFIKQAHRVKAYKNVYLDVISLRHDMLRPDLPRVRKFCHLYSCHLVN